MQTNDRAEYEASFVLTQLREAMRGRSLETIIRDGLTPHRSKDRAAPEQPAPADSKEEHRAEFLRSREEQRRRDRDQDGGRER